jgi:hypothetical protein
MAGNAWRRTDRDRAARDRHRRLLGDLGDLPTGGSTWAASQRIRLRVIVSTSLNVTFESLIPVIAYPALGDQRSVPPRRVP